MGHWGHRTTSGRGPERRGLRRPTKQCVGLGPRPSALLPSAFCLLPESSQQPFCGTTPARKARVLTKAAMCGRAREMFVFKLCGFVLIPAVGYRWLGPDSGRRCKSSRKKMRAESNLHLGTLACARAALRRRARAAWRLEAVAALFCVSAGTLGAGRWASAPCSRPTNQLKDSLLLTPYSRGRPAPRRASRA